MNRTEHLSRAPKSATTTRLAPAIESAATTVGELRALSRRRDRFVATPAREQRRFDGAINSGDQLRLPALQPLPPEVLCAAMDRVLAKTDPESAMAAALREARASYSAVVRT